MAKYASPSQAAEDYILQLTKKVFCMRIFKPTGTSSRYNCHQFKTVHYTRRAFLTKLENETTCDCQDYQSDRDCVHVRLFQMFAEKTHPVATQCNSEGTLFLIYNAGVNTAWAYVGDDEFAVVSRTYFRERKATIKCMKCKEAECSHLKAVVRAIVSEAREERAREEKGRKEEENTADEENTKNTSATSSPISTYRIPYPSNNNGVGMDWHAHGKKFHLKPTITQDDRCEHGFQFSTKLLKINGPSPRCESILNTEIGPVFVSVYYYESLGHCKCKKCYTGEAHRVLNLNNRHLFTNDLLGAFYSNLTSKSNTIHAFHNQLSLKLTPEKRQFLCNVQYLIQAIESYGHRLDLDPKLFSCPKCTENGCWVIGCDGIQMGCDIKKHTMHRDVINITRGTKFKGKNWLRIFVFNLYSKTRIHIRFPQKKLYLHRYNKFVFKKDTHSYQISTKEIIFTQVQQIRTGE